MPILIPKQFGRRERLLTIVASASGLVVGAIACFAPFGAYGGWLLLAIVGHFAFLAVGHQQRAYVAGIFGLVLSTFMGIELSAETILKNRQLPGKDEAFVSAMLFLWLVVFPVSLGAFISWVRRHEENAA